MKPSIIDLQESGLHLDCSQGTRGRRRQTGDKWAILMELRYFAASEEFRVPVCVCVCKACERNFHPKALLRLLLHSSCGRGMTAMHCGVVLL
jgi:hypothetical protein